MPAPTASLGDSIRNKVQSGNANSANRQMHDQISNKVRNDVSSRINNPRDTVTRSPRATSPADSAGWWWSASRADARRA